MRRRQRIEMVFAANTDAALHLVSTACPPSQTNELAKMDIH